MEKSLFTCPICAAPLERAYACPNGHAYDKAREGYVHLLPANKKHSKAPGDDKGMAEARRRFLSGGYYGHLLAALCALGAEYAPPGEAVLDSGCGEGYYTAGLWETLGRPPLAGIDLSKPSVRLAARRVPEGEFAVASAYHLPLADASVGLVLNCFSPLALDEFRRVLRPGGAFLYVVPAADHLWELKQVLYDQPYRNREEDVPYEGFSYERVEPVEAVVDVAGEALRDLFQMTPYYWKTPREGAERLAAPAPHRSDGVPVYDGRCRRLPPEELARLARSRRPAWRVRVPEEVLSFRDLLQGGVSQDLSLDCGDFILRRSDGVYAYQLAVVVDDGAMGVTQVVRGSDLLDSTPRQLWLQERLGLPHPEYGHVPLLLAPDGRRLAKRDRDQELGALQSCYSAQELVGQLALLAGLIPEYAPISPAELIPLFSWEKLPQADCAVHWADGICTFFTKTIQSPVQRDRPPV